MILFTCLIGLKWVSGRGRCGKGVGLGLLVGGHWLRGIVERKAESIGGAWLLTGGKKNNKTKPTKKKEKETSLI